MRHTRRAFAALALFAALAACSSAALAQQTGAPAPSGRIVVIDSGAFSDEKEGIARVAAAVKQVDAQFEAPRAELRRLTDQYNALVKEIQDTQRVANPQTLAQKQDQAEQLQLQIKRKQEDGQAAYQKRMGEVLDPLQQDVANALTAYAKARGIAIIIDLNRVPVIYAADSVDITKDFIAEYNRTHPAAAAPVTGRP